MYAGKGKVEIQAQSDGADLIARKGIRIVSTEDRIEITSPKEIVLTAGGSQIKINSSGIFPTTGGKFEVKAGQHVFSGGGRIDIPILILPKFPEGKEYTKKIILKDSEGKPLIDCNYFIFFEDGEVESGKTNSRGETHLIETEMSKKFYIHFNKDFDSDLNFQEEF